MRGAWHAETEGLGRGYYCLLGLAQAQGLDHPFVVVCQTGGVME